MEIFVIISLSFTVAPRRYKRDCVLTEHVFNNGIRVVPLVGQDILEGKIFQQRNSQGTISLISDCYQESDRHSMRVCRYVYLGTYTSFGSLCIPDSPGAPMPCWCTLMWLASIMTHSRSGQSARFVACFSQKHAFASLRNLTKILFKFP